MIRESRSQEEESLGTSFSPRAMLPLAVATSIDALTVGITFAFLQVDILLAVSLIGLTTFLLSAVGVKAGAVVGSRGKSWGGAGRRPGPGAHGVQDPAGTSGRPFINAQKY